MNQSRYAIGVLAALTATLIHGASENISAALTTLSKPNMHDFIGFASGKAGSCMLHTPELVEPGKDFPITIIYTEIHNLYSSEMPLRITQKTVKKRFNKTRRS